MSFDIEPDGDSHGECSLEIQRLNQELTASLAAHEKTKAELESARQISKKNEEILAGKICVHHPDKERDEAHSQCVVCTMKELTHANADRLQLREALEFCRDHEVRRLYITCSNCGTDALCKKEIRCRGESQHLIAIEKALSSPPPPVVSQAEHDALKAKVEALKGYAKHKSNCDLERYDFGNQVPCTCELTKLLEE